MLNNIINNKKLLLEESELILCITEFLNKIFGKNLDSKKFFIETV
jgi:hypothetical protein